MVQEWARARARERGGERVRVRGRESYGERERERAPLNKRKSCPRIDR